jgi:hypothetical protein
MVGERIHTVEACNPLLPQGEPLGCTDPQVSVHGAANRPGCTKPRSPRLPQRGASSLDADAAAAPCRAGVADEPVHLEGRL